MIAEDYVSFEVAKLLEEKGFNEACFAFYNPEGMLIQSGIRLNNIQVGVVKGSYSAPTLQMAMKWLREVHGLHVDIDPLEGNWRTKIVELEDLCEVDRGISLYGTYEEACEAAIKYCLENLI